MLALVEENTAAGIHYGIDRVFENASHTLAIYNMGSEATQVTLFRYDAYTLSSGGKNKTVGQAHVLAKAWDTRLGGRHFDRALIDYVAGKFNADNKVAKHLPASAAGDIRNVPLSMAKIRRAVTKAKEVRRHGVVVRRYGGGDVGGRAVVGDEALFAITRTPRATSTQTPRPPGSASHPHSSHTDSVSTLRCSPPTRSTRRPSSPCSRTSTFACSSRARSWRRRRARRACSRACPPCWTPP